MTWILGLIVPRIIAGSDFFTVSYSMMLKKDHNNLEINKAGIIVRIWSFHFITTSDSIPIRVCNNYPASTNSRFCLIQIIGAVDIIIGRSIIVSICNSYSAPPISQFRALPRAPVILIIFSYFIFSLFIR